MKFLLVLLLACTGVTEDHVFMNQDLHAPLGDTGFIHDLRQVYGYEFCINFNEDEHVYITNRQATEDIGGWGTVTKDRIIILNSLTLEFERDEERWNVTVEGLVPPAYPYSGQEFVLKDCPYHYHLLQDISR